MGSMGKHWQSNRLGFLMARPSWKMDGGVGQIHSCWFLVVPCHVRAMTGAESRLHERLETLLKAEPLSLIDTGKLG